MDNSIKPLQETSRKPTMTYKVEIINAKLKSEALFNKLRELIILHEGEEYKLRITANNKLILTK